MSNIDATVNPRAILMEQGNSLSFTFNFQQSDGTPMDMSGHAANLQVRQTYGSSKVEINCNLQNGKLSWTNAAGGVLVLELEPSDTSGIRFLNKDDDTLDCVYDLEITSPAGRVFKPLRGDFTLNREVTRIP